MPPFAVNCVPASVTVGLTQIGNDWFTWFGTRASKSRLNFLELLRAGHTDYVLNDEAYGYMRKHGGSGANRLKDRAFRFYVSDVVCFITPPAPRSRWRAHFYPLDAAGGD